MDFIQFPASMTMLDLVRYLVKDNNTSFSFYSGKLASSDKDDVANNSQLSTVCHYICKKVREEWIVQNIGIISIENGELMICVTSPDSSMPAEVISFIVEAIAVSIINLDQVKAKTTLNRSESNESMEEDISPEMVQVKAGTLNEVVKRITEFMRYKRAQTDINNVLDFCGEANHNQSCARVDAVLIRKKDSSSHMAVRNVLDRYTTKHNTEKVGKNQTTATMNTHNTDLAAFVMGLPSHNNQHNTKHCQKGEKRTYDVASLEEMLNKVKKQ